MSDTTTRKSPDSTAQPVVNNTRAALKGDRRARHTRIRLNNNGYFASGMLVGGLIVGFTMWFLLMAEPAAAAATTTVTPTTGWTFQGIVLATILAVIVASAVAFMIIVGYLRTHSTDTVVDLNDGVERMVGDSDD